ncbi:uncharacterized protein LOC124630324 [Helicoverpa zea]|uniref:uncharacterized protein LOC124630324 n=1 Tax=Helicoverpa zea TaxID=7113 RepID=UPI001F5736E7|nr:uncharacterized protein LOC124630324 [Helicoverpa zea]
MMILVQTQGCPEFRTRVEEHWNRDTESPVMRLGREAPHARGVLGDNVQSNQGYHGCVILRLNIVRILAKSAEIEEWFKGQKRELFIHLRGQYVIGLRVLSQMPMRIFEKGVRVGTGYDLKAKHIRVRLLGVKGKEVGVQREEMVSNHHFLILRDLSVQIQQIIF